MFQWAALACVQLWMGFQAHIGRDTVECQSFQLEEHFGHLRTQIPSAQMSVRTFWRAEARHMVRQARSIFSKSAQSMPIIEESEKLAPADFFDCSEKAWLSSLKLVAWCARVTPASLEATYREWCANKGKISADDHDDECEDDYDYFGEEEADADDSCKIIQSIQEEPELDGELDEQHKVSDLRDMDLRDVPDLENLHATLDACPDAADVKEPFRVGCEGPLNNDLEISRICVFDCFRMRSWSFVYSYFLLFILLISFVCLLSFVYGFSGWFFCAWFFRFQYVSNCFNLFHMGHTRTWPWLPPHFAPRRQLLHGSAIRRSHRWQALETNHVPAILAWRWWQTLGSKSTKQPQNIFPFVVVSEPWLIPHPPDSSHIYPIHSKSIQFYPYLINSYIFLSYLHNSSYYSHLFPIAVNQCRPY